MASSYATARAVLAAHVRHLERLFRGRSAVSMAGRRTLQVVRPTLGFADLRGTANELAQRWGLAVEPLRLALRRLARASGLFGRDRGEWVVRGRTAWERGRIEVGSTGAPDDGRACGEAVERWSAGYQPDGGRPLLAEWRRRLLRPRAAGGLADTFAAVRETVELLAARPDGAAGCSASEAARSLLGAADHRAVERVARALRYLARRGHLDAGGWRPAADCSMHPALLRLELPPQRDVAAASGRMCWFLACRGVEHPDQLSAGEARTVAQRLWAQRAASNPAREVEQRNARRADDEMSWLEWVESTNDEFAAAEAA